MSAPEILLDHNAHALLERRHLRPLEYRGGPYPLARALRLFRRAGREFGITEGAAAALRSIDDARKLEAS